MTSDPATYPDYRFPAEIISHATWLYHVFSLSLRDAELILAERGILVTYESIRQWCAKFGAEVSLVQGWGLRPRWRRNETGARPLHRSGALSLPFKASKDRSRATPRWQPRQR